MHGNKKEVIELMYLHIIIFVDENIYILLLYEYNIIGINNVTISILMYFVCKISHINKIVDLN